MEVVNGADPGTSTPVVLDADATDEDLGRLATLHRACLPWTASSRAGVQVVAAMYRALAADADGIVLWCSAVRGGPEGGFASGTIDLRATERRLRSRLGVTALAKLGIYHLLAPAHLWSRRRWESVIPRGACGYVLTLGARRGSDGSGARGRVLLEELESRFRQRGVADSWVDTETSNVRALDFYRRAGYSVVRQNAGQLLLRKAL